MPGTPGILYLLEMKTAAFGRGGGGEYTSRFFLARRYAGSFFDYVPGSLYEAEFFAGTGGSKLPRFTGRVSLIIGHRGAPVLERENTLASFRKAVELGADMVELDVRATKDSELVVHHNVFLEAGGRVFYVSELPYREMAEIAHYEIPVLEQVLAELKGKVMFDVELKEPEFENDVLRLMRKYLGYEEAVLTSFDRRVLETLLELGSKWRSGLLVDQNDVSEAVDWCTNYGISMLAPHFELVEDQLVTGARCRDINVFVWTVNCPEKMMEYFRMGVSGLITDVPDIALQVRNYR